MLGLSVLLTVFAAVWLLQLDWTSLSPPTDNIEQLTWVHALEWGYYKHPPLPTWLFWLFEQVLGATARTTYVAGAACTLASMALMWSLLRRLRGAHAATVALLAALCITYYNARLYYYNHETVLMVLVAASAWACWRAHVSGSMRWWAALGLALGLGALAKYQIAVSVACVLVFWLQQRAWRVRAHRHGLLLAAAVALLVLAPHLDWLRSHDFAPIRYASESSLAAGVGFWRRCAGALIWVFNQLINRAFPAWLLLAWAAHGARRAAAEPVVAPAATPDASAAATALQASSRSFLLIWGGLPLAFMPTMGLLTGAGLQLHWGTPFLLFAVPAVMELTSGRVAWSRVPLRSVWLAFGIIQALLLMESVLSSPKGPALLQEHRWRAFDSAALAQAIESPARAALGGRICVVSGPPDESGALALQLHDRPLVLIDGRQDHSPWVPRDLVAECGMVRLRAAAAGPGWHAAGAAFPKLSWQVALPHAVP
ncbi:MAG: glycosyltransferase family 39 protein [Pseudomonadota bacterium]|nr:glycosyltransferase family 39 protein [Pseudomonadota bacterium]